MFVLNKKLIKKFQVKNGQKSGILTVKYAHGGHNSSAMDSTTFLVTVK